MSIKVSVIIPVFNAEKYIAECIESLLAQTLFESEFIFINDGSSDNSVKIITEYQKIDHRIKFLDQKNQGVSVARNNGLSIASGEYIGFVDADDFVDEDMFETLYSTAKLNSCDVVISNFKSEMDGRKETIILPFQKDINLNDKYIKEELLPYFLKSDGLNAIWNKLYKSKIIKKNKIAFPQKVALGEDGLFNIKFFSYAANARFINYSGYHYREVEGSATRNIVEKDYFHTALEVFHMEIPEINKVITDKKIIKRLKSVKLINSVVSLIHIYFTPRKDVNISKRFKYVNNMIGREEVRLALPLYVEFFHDLGRYERLIIKLIRKQSSFGLYFVTAYSRFRNR